MERWFKVLLSRVPVLSAFVCLSTKLSAQEPAVDIIRGRVFAPDTTPVANALVQVTATGTALTREARTRQSGLFAIIYPGASGDYIVRVTASGFAVSQRRVQRRAQDEQLIVADFRLSRANPISLNVIEVKATRREKVGRESTAGRQMGNSETAEVSASEALSGDAIGGLLPAIATAPGISLVFGADGQPAGFSVLGLGPEQNTLTVNGVTMAAANLPRDALANATIATTTFDPAQGGFSGGRLALRTFSMRGTAARSLQLTFDHPQLQWASPRNSAPGATLGGRYSNAQFGGYASGSLLPDKLFHTTSFQLGQRTSDLPVLPTNGSLAFDVLGLAADSVRRLLAVASSIGLPVPSNVAPGNQSARNVSLQTTLEAALGGDQRLSVSALGSWEQTAGAFLGTTTHSSSGGDHGGRSGGVSATYSRYLRATILNTTRSALSAADSWSRPYLDLPSAKVMLASPLEEGAVSLVDVSLGGNPNLSAQGRSWTGEVVNQTAWFTLDSRHQLTFSASARVDGHRSTPVTNRLGTFTFNSLADFEASRPTSYTRTLGERETRSEEISGWASLGDQWRVTSRLRLTYGARVEGNRFLTAPAYNSLVDQLFGLRTDLTPNSVHVSPRLGFSWSHGTVPFRMKSGYGNESQRGLFWGGVGEFRNVLRPELLEGAMNATGLHPDVAQLACVGAAAPRPEWDRYAHSVATIPDHCADGTSASLLSEERPPVITYDRRFAPTRSWRAHIGWVGRLTTRLDGSAELMSSLNLDQPGAVDVNFAADPRFFLSDEGNRPVFVSTTSIVPSTGAVSARDARRTDTLAQVLVNRSDLRSGSTQLKLRVTPLAPYGPLSMSLAYVYLRQHEQTRGFGSGTTFRDPNRSAWRAGAQDGTHQFTVNLSVATTNVSMQLFGRFQSGYRYTPLVAGDVNGDGLANDRAFIFDPNRSDDSAVAHGMSSLLTRAPRLARKCLLSQLGHAAADNSCRAPWTSSVNLLAQTRPGRVGISERVTISLYLTNVLSAADLLLHGERGARGWGQGLYADPVLLVPRGFDTNAARFFYGVNPRFGNNAAASAMIRNPFRVTLGISLELGPDRNRAAIDQLLRSVNVDESSGGASNAVTTTATGARLTRQLVQGTGVGLGTLLQYRDSIGFTAGQVDSVGAVQRRLVLQVETLAEPLAAYLVALGLRYDVKEAATRYRRYRESVVAAEVRAVREVRSILTQEQLRRLSPFLARWLDETWIQSVLLRSF